MPSCFSHTIRYIPRTAGTSRQNPARPGTTRRGLCPAARLHVALGRVTLFISDRTIPSESSQRGYAEQLLERQVLDAINIELHLAGYVVAIGSSRKLAALARGSPAKGWGHSQRPSKRMDEEDHDERRVISSPPDDREQRCPRKATRATFHNSRPSLPGPSRRPRPCPTCRRRRTCPWPRRTRAWPISRPRSMFPTADKFLFVGVCIPRMDN